MRVPAPASMPEGPRKGKRRSGREAAAPVPPERKREGGLGRGPTLRPGRAHRSPKWRAGLVGPHRDLVLAGVAEVEAAPAGRGKDITGDLATGSAHPGARFIQVAGVEHDQWFGWGG